MTPDYIRDYELEEDEDLWDTWEENPQVGQWTERQDILTALLEQQAARNRGHVCSFNSVYPVSIKCFMQGWPSLNIF